LRKHNFWEKNVTRKMLIAGNWKMNGSQSCAAEFKMMVETVSTAQYGKNDILICPPTTLLAGFSGIAGSSGMHVGGEDCFHGGPSGAHTGDISAEMLKDAGASYCIVGHSERRADHGESDALVKSKAEAAIRAGLIAIVCVGETLEQREAGEAVAVVSSQIRNSLPAEANAANCVIAYEPVWAIGTGKTATLNDIKEIHGSIRDLLQEIGGAELTKCRVLYGGSVKPANAGDIFGLEDVDGGLVGGASLKAADFCGIVDGAA
jgi:triosephosphate isomerase